jgi:26S proteasome regulatory subunit N2
LRFFILRTDSSFFTLFFFPRPSAKAIDEYIERRSSPESEDEIDQRLTSVVERMFDRCFRDDQYRQAIGVALETRRLDKLEEAVALSPNPGESLAYATKACQTLVTSREFRLRTLRALVKMYETVSGAETDHLNVCQCLMFLDDAEGVALILGSLVDGAEDERLLGYQIGFSLHENEIQAFLNKVSAQLVPVAGAGDTTETDGMDTEKDGEEKPVGEQPVAPRALLRSVLSGELPVALHLEFLFSHNSSDLLLLKQIRTAVESRNSVCHSATVLCNALMHAGTTVDTFLRENLDWLSRATNWARFSATAGMGVIHHGQLSEGRTLMGPFLPREGASGGGARPSPYTEGGALYALGLIHANHGENILPFLLESGRSSNNEVIQHGACLGLGLAALGTGNEEVYTDMFRILRTDGAVAGEAAGIGIGLLLAGLGPETKQREILNYCHKTAHEKIIRGCSVGLALTAYGKEESAEPLVEQMVRDSDPIIRYGGVLAVASAYVATGNNAAVRRLLHVAVSDVSDDVRRAAVMSLGFVLCSTPAQCPRVVGLLAESYNPHVRYGAAMAVGICCAGTGMKEAIALLEPMLTDPVDFVQQGALIATAMVLIEQSESNLAPFRKRLSGHINDEREVTMTKMGAIMAQGIVDAGGRNVTIGLRAKSGFPRMTAVAAMLVFTQYWYWYPLSYFVSLTFVPTAFVGLDSTLKMPHCSVTSHCKPSLFAYPAPTVADDKKDKGVVVKAVLSTTAKAKAKAARKVASSVAKAEGGGVEDVAMDTDEKTEEKDAEKNGEDETKAETDTTPEPLKEELANPARVTPAQERFVKFETGSRFVPAVSSMSTKTRGFVVLKDTTPSEEVEYVASTRTIVPGVTGPAAGAAGAAAAATEEPAAPEAFEFDPDDV